ncbi:MAG: transposase [Bacteroidetes bacterium]|nr:transposase [Bacteroidota bacterium]
MELLLIHDRFHLMQYLNKALNQVRKREVKDHPELKRSRDVLLKNEKNRTKKQDEIFMVIKESNLNVSIAWRLREDFKAIFECTSFQEAKEYFNLWLDEVQEAGVKEVIKIADMFKNHFDGVCNALWNRQSNAKAERINEKFQAFKTFGGGYRTFENFRVATLFFCGGLDLYPHNS